MARKKKTTAEEQSDPFPSMESMPVAPDPIASPPPDDGSSPDPLIGNESVARLAVGHWDGHRWVYLSVHMNGSNLMGTTTPNTAKTWGNQTEVDEWVKGLNPDNLASLASKRRHIVKIKSVHFDPPIPMPIEGPHLTASE